MGGPAYEEHFGSCSRPECYDASSSDREEKETERPEFEDVVTYACDNSAEELPTYEDMLGIFSRLRQKQCLSNGSEAPMNENKSPEHASITHENERAVLQDQKKHDLHQKHEVWSTRAGLVATA